MLLKLRIVFVVQRIIAAGFEFPREKPLIPSMRSFDKFERCFAWHLVHGHPNRAHVLAVYGVIRLIMMPRCWNFGRGLLNENVLMVKHAATAQNN